MMMYVLICLSLSLAGVAGLQFFYMMYLERLDKDKKKRLRELENHCKYLNKRLHNAEMQIAERDEFIDSIYEEVEEGEELWADVIDEG
ncbi:MAG: hypothetical protein ACR2J3_07910 [Aridibacter sp.]